MAAMTIDLSIDFSRATASAICSSSSLFALTTMFFLPSLFAGPLRPPAQSNFLFVFVRGVRFRTFGHIVVRFTAASLGFLALPVVLGQRFANEVVGQDQPDIGDGIVGHAHCRLLAIGRLIALDQHVVLTGLGDLALEALAVGNDD